MTNVNWKSRKCMACGHVISVLEESTRYHCLGCTANVRRHTDQNLVAARMVQRLRNKNPIRAS